MKKSNSLKGPLLLVEDDVVDQKIFKRAFESLGIKYKIIMANNGEEAMDVLRTLPEPPCIIISDINMPRMDGIELITEIEKDQALKEKAIPFIFMTSSVSPFDVNRAFDHTAHGYFEKSHDYEQFKSNLNLIVTYWENSHSKGNP